MATISENQIQYVKNSVDIIDFVSNDVNLKPSGKYLKGLCPFHKEKTPSFFVDPGKQNFRCYGCGKHGDVYNYIMETQHLPFVDTLKKVASSAGITLVYEKQDAEENTHRELLFKANKLAADFFHFKLVNEKANHSALEYFYGRDITSKTINSFILGYAPDSWDDFYKFLPSTGIPLEIFTELGLIMPNKQGGHYDRFRNRIIFPILNHKGNTVGFGARKLKEEDQPKYLNSPESSIYKKKELLYGLFYAAESIRKEGFAIFVEGYMDFLRLYQEGIKNVVATSGTALTAEQGKLIKRYCNTVYMCYDSDDAGIRSTVKSSRILLGSGIDLKMIVLPKGDDPDTFILNKGKDAFLHSIGQAPEFSDYLLRYYRSNNEYETPNGKTKAARHVLSLIARIPDRLKQDFYIQDLSRKMQIDENIMKAELATQIGLLKKETEQSDQRSMKNLVHEKSSKKFIESAGGVFHGNYEAEKQAIFFLLQLDDTADATNFLFKLSMEHFQNEDTREIMHDIFTQVEERGKIDILSLEEKFASFFKHNSGKMIYIKEIVDASEKEKYRYSQDILNRIEESKLIRDRALLDKEFAFIKHGTKEYQEKMKERMEIARKIQNLRGANINAH